MTASHHRVIYIYRVSSPGEVLNVPMPKGAEILRYGMQGAEHYIWALVALNVALEGRQFATYGTGGVIGAGRDETYIGTVDDGPFVWHLFERHIADTPTGEPRP